MFKPNLINMNVYSATCSCSVELYKQWFTLAEFFPKLGFSRVSLQIINFAVRISAAAMAGDIIFFSLACPVGYCCDFSRCFFFLFPRAGLAGLLTCSGLLTATALVHWSLQSPAGRASLACSPARVYPPPPHWSLQPPVSQVYPCRQISRTCPPLPHWSLQPPAGRLWLVCSTAQACSPPPHWSLKPPVV